MFMKKVKHLKNTKKRNCQFSIESLFIINTDIQKKKKIVIIMIRIPLQKLFLLEKTKVEKKNGTNIFH